MGKDDLKKLIAQARLDEAVDQLLEQIKAYSPASKSDKSVSKLSDILIINSGKLHGLQHDKMLGILDRQTEQITLAQVHQAILYVIDELPDEFWNVPQQRPTAKQNSGNEQTELLEAVESLKQVQPNEFEYDLFVSFSSLDRELLQPVVEKLRGYGLRVFISDQNLKDYVGISFSESIGHALENSQHFVLVSSPNSYDSYWVIIEYETFFNQFHYNDRKNRRIFVLKGFGFEMRFVPLFLRRMQIADNAEEIVHTLVAETKAQEKLIIKNEELRIKERKARESAEEAEKELIENEKKAKLLADKQQRAEKDQLEQLKLAEEKAEQIRLAAQKVEEERIENEKQAKLLADKQLKEKQQKAEHDRLEQQKLVEEKAEQKRLAAQKAEEERIETEKQAKFLVDKQLKEKQQKAEKERLEQQKLQEELERAEKQRLAALKSEEERIENEKQAKLIADQQLKEKQQKAEQDRLEQQIIKEEQAEQKRLLQIEETKKALTERIRQQKLKNDRQQKLFYLLLPFVLIICIYIFYIAVSDVIRVNKLAIRQSSGNIISKIDSFPIEMVFVKGGEFMMGYDNSAEKDEKPAHKVVVSDFYIGKYEVTQKQWTDIMGTNPLSFKGCDNCPVESVSWNNVQEFLKKLNQKTGKTYRLPTEAEWEYAAGGGANKRTKWAGTDNEDELGVYAWYDKNSGGKTHPVGLKKPNNLGIYDMTGNVWEWCGDYYGSDYYTNSPLNNPKGPSTGPSRVMRGGSWDLIADNGCVANRYFITPGRDWYDLGFRLSLALEFTSGPGKAR